MVVAQGGGRVVQQDADLRTATGECDAPKCGQFVGAGVAVTGEHGGVDGQAMAGFMQQLQPGVGALVTVGGRQCTYIAGLDLATFGGGQGQLHHPVGQAGVVEYVAECAETGAFVETDSAQLGRQHDGGCTLATCVADQFAQQRRSDAMATPRGQYRHATDLAFGVEAAATDRCAGVVACQHMPAAIVAAVAFAWLRHALLVDEDLLTDVQQGIPITFARPVGARHVKGLQLHRRRGLRGSRWPSLTSASSKVIALASRVSDGVMVRCSHSCVAISARAG
jgi:hypothetical protein